MPNIRRADQITDAFSLPKSLHSQVKAEALRRRLTKSGFIRYCLAKEVGWSEAEAKEVAEHGAIRHALTALTGRVLKGSESSDVSRDLMNTKRTKPKRKVG